MPNLHAIEDYKSWILSSNSSKLSDSHYNITPRPELVNRNDFKLRQRPKSKQSYQDPDENQPSFFGKNTLKFFRASKIRKEDKIRPIRSWRDHIEDKAEPLPHSGD